jgi:amidase/aspartyl-tRNA(Asn)/glutamyl-tRNA(Gln) amidotransferase subunit A
MSRDLCYQSATDIADDVRGGTLSALEVVDAHLERIAERNDALTAFVTVLDSDARERARQIDRAVEAGKDPGPLAGVPVALKDIYGFKKGVRNTFGCAPLSDFRPDEDAVFVERLEDAGAIILGKTNVPEFGHKGTTDNEIFGPTSTPFDLRRNAGGSSGGSAAAVAAGLSPLAQGSDGGGSVRIPASFCGVVGLKASHRRIPNRERPDAFGSSTPYIHYGPLGRTVEDVALMMSVMAGVHWDDPHSLPDDGMDYRAATARSIEGFSVAYSKDLGTFPVASSVRSVIDDAVGAFTDAGADLSEVDVDMPYTHEELCETWMTMHDYILAKTNETFARTEGLNLLGDHKEELTPVVARQMERGLAADAMSRFETSVVRSGVFDAIQAVFDDHDLLVTPTLAVPPTENTTTLDGQAVGPSEVAGETVDPLLGWCLTYPINFTGHPAASVPAGFTSDGLPVGLQIIGPRFDEAAVLAASAAFERERPWESAYQRIA